MKEISVLTRCCLKERERRGMPIRLSIPADGRMENTMAKANSPGLMVPAIKATMSMASSKAMADIPILRGRSTKENGPMENRKAAAFLEVLTETRSRKESGPMVAT